MIISGNDWRVIQGNNLEVLPTLADNSVDAIVTDPPYELGFMGKRWDSSGIAYNVELWGECLRVLKPGGHLLSFGGSRTWHRLAVAIEDAGFEIRDSVAWISNKTFPKSLDISKAIDKQLGVEREITGTRTVPDQRGGKINSQATAENGVKQRTIKTTKPTSEEAQKWQGWGTALKPTVEPIVMARKPLVGTVAENVLEYGTGGLNIDATRIGGGRWPANVIFDEEAAQDLDRMSGVTKSPHTYVRGVGTLEGSRVAYGNIGEVAGTLSKNYGDAGGASRFFYVVRPSKKDRNEGLDELPAVTASVGDNRPSGDFNQRLGTQDKPAQPKQNFHPTVKPTALMEYLIKLVTPPRGVVLDPFTGSGSTGKAAILNGFQFVGIELTEEYLPIIEGRLKFAEGEAASRLL